MFLYDYVYFIGFFKFIESRHMFWEEKISLKLYFHSDFAEYAFHGNIYKCELTYYMTLINFVAIF